MVRFSLLDSIKRSFDSNRRLILDRILCGYALPIKKPALKEHSTPPGERDTRARLLDTAVQLFGAHGFAAVSVRDIAQEAGVNLAAVNYHFSSKEKLWQEALRHSLGFTEPILEDLRPILQAARQTGTVAAAESALRQMLERFLEETLRPDYEQSTAMLFWELMGTRRNLQMVVNEFFVPKRLMLRQVLELLWPDADRADLDLWVVNIIGQCVSIKHCLPITAIAMKWEPVSEEHLRSLIKHTVEFCLSAIRGAQAAG